MVVWKQTTLETVVMARLRCKSWQCPHCARENRAEWRKHLTKVLPKISSNWWFVTLTAHAALRSATTSLVNLRSNIDRLFKRIRRVWSNVEYVRVYEVHKKGAFHAHLLVSGLSSRVQKFTASNGIHYYRPTLSNARLGCWSARTWFSRTAWDLGMGYMVDVQSLEGTTNAVGYVVKYLSKAAQEFHVKGLRRVQTSRKIGSPRVRGDGTWTAAERVFRGNLPKGTRLYDASLKLWIPDSYWSENLTYPKPNSSP